jgi:hypothetical protein
MRRSEWVARRDAWVRVRDGATITKVNPRGTTLYALRLPGTVRPEWHQTLKLAQEAAR